MQSGKFFWVILFVFLVDQSTKMIMRATDSYIINAGAAFGILPGARWLFITVAIIVVIWLVMIRHTFKNDWWGYALVVGGALGNLADRLIFRGVTDFICFFRFPCFNVADMALTVGVFCIVLYSIPAAFWQKMAVFRFTTQKKHLSEKGKKQGFRGSKND